MITAAIERNGFVYVYGEGNRSLFSVLGELHGYTGTSVSVRRGDFIYIYNEKGGSQGSRFAPQKH